MTDSDVVQNSPNSFLLNKYWKKQLPRRKKWKIKKKVKEIKKEKKKKWEEKRKEVKEGDRQR